MRRALIRLSALGDIVHTWPLASALRVAVPQAHITWIVEEPLRILVEGHPAVDAVLDVATKRWRSRPTARRTRAEIAVLKGRFAELQADVCIDAQGVIKSAVVARWSAADRKVGLARPWRREWLPGLFYTETVDGSTHARHVVATNLEIVRAVGGTPPRDPVPPDGRWLLDRVRDRLPTGSWASPFAVLLPAAGHPSKILPVATLARVARGLVELGIEAVVAWGPAERERAHAVAAMAGRGTHMAPPTDLAELSALLGAATVVVGGDTGPVHLAASFGVPTAAAFLTTDWRRNGPLGSRIAVVSGTADSDTGPTGSARARPIRGITAAELLDAARSVIDGVSG